LKRGGILDRFPLHLFCPETKWSRILIIDHPDLGILQPTAFSAQDKTVIVVCHDKDVLAKTKKNLPKTNHSNYLFIQADPEKLPLKNESVDGVIFLSNPPVTKKNSPNAINKSIFHYPELLENICSTGWLIRINLKPTPTNNRKSLLASEKAYSVWPKSGQVYLVTNKSDSDIQSFTSFALSRLLNLQAK